MPPSEYNHTYKENAIRKVMARESVLTRIVAHEEKHLELQSKILFEHQSKRSEQLNADEIKLETI